ncbi:hypothetical protein VNO77_28016 [Canavalia gladiata]|uniref:F-box domain-containing protein n=1 Tax=Canavalia gladiata TaxID=3824 RepID=A0AAN9Q714_CANGL
MSPLCYTLIIIFTTQLLFTVCKKRKEVCAREDGISKLPNHILSSIISLLPAEEALRTSVLAKHWKHLWSQASRLDFNQNCMLESAFQRWFEVYKDPNTSPGEVFDAFDLLMLQFEDAIKSIKKVLTYHCGVLERCRIVHITNSCRNGDLVGLIRYLVDVKRVHEIDLECKYIESWDRVEYFKNFKGDAEMGIPIRNVTPPTLDLCFHKLAGNCAVLKLMHYVLKNSPLLRVCENLKTLKLNKVWLSEGLFEGILLKCVSLENLSLIGCKQFKKLRIHGSRIKFLELREMTLHMIHVVAVNLEVIVFDTLVCQWKGLVVDAPNLRVIRVYYGDPIGRGMPKLRFQRVLLTTRVILEIFTNLVTSEGSVRPNMLENLVTLCIDLDLNGQRDITALYLALKSCNSLEQLEINNQDFYGSQNSSPTDFKFWERREPSICIFQKLKTVRISGIKGKVLEFEFIKYVIRKAKLLTRMTLVFVNENAHNAFTSNTVSVMGTSKDLCITLMTAGQECIEKD